MRIAVLDIGGTSIKSGVWDGKTLTETEERETCAQEGGAAVVERVVAVLRGYKIHENFEAVGISTAGQVNTREGSIHYANPNIPGYTGMPLKEILEREFCVPAAIENDVNAATLGEMSCGAAKGQESFLCLTYGTGVGGAIVLNGEICHGSNWAGGYFGGILVHPEKRRAGAELSGCYEQYASASALVRNARRVDAALTDGRKVFAAFDRPEVRAVIDSWVDEIVWGLITLIHIFDPPMVVLGGGILGQPYVIDEVRARTRGRLDPGFKNVRIVRAQLGNQAGMTGAAVLAGKALAYWRGK